MADTTNDNTNTLIPPGGIYPGATLQRQSRTATIDAIITILNSGNQPEQIADDIFTMFADTYYRTGLFPDASDNEPF